MKNLMCFVLLLAACSAIAAQEDYQPSESNLQAREWFQDARFGLFVHWGVYSVMGGGGDLGGGGGLGDEGGGESPVVKEMAG